MDSDNLNDDDFVGEATLVLTLIYSCIINLLIIYIFHLHFIKILSCNFRIPLEPVLVEGNVPPTSYNVVKDDQYCGEIRVGLTFTPEV